MIFEASAENIAQAARLLKAGKLVAFPTETVYGLGADATNDLSVKEIFRVKGRPSIDPLIVHLSCAEEIDQVAETGACQVQLRKLSKFWPGPLSLVLPKKDLIPGSVTAGLDTVAVRVPAHPVALQLLKATALPIAAPSANPFCYVSPTEAQHVEEMLGSKIGMILDGGPCRVGIESTVLSLAEPRPTILRPGVIHKSMLEEALGEEILSSSVKAQHGLESKPLLSPGTSEKHYSPKTRLRFIDEIEVSELRGAVGLIKFREDFKDLGWEFQAVHTLSSNNNPDEIATNLYKAIREQDKLNLDLILVDRCAEKGIGVALMDRLKRATAK